MMYDLMYYDILGVHSMIVSIYSMLYARYELLC